MQVLYGHNIFFGWIVGFSVETILEESEFGFGPKHGGSGQVIGQV